MGDLVLPWRPATDGGEFARPVVDAIHALDELADDRLSSRELMVAAVVIANPDKSWAALFEDYATLAAVSSALESAPRGDSVTNCRAVWVDAASDSANEDPSPSTRTWM